MAAAGTEHATAALGLALLPEVERHVRLAGLLVCIHPQLGVETSVAWRGEEGLSWERRPEGRGEVARRLHRLLASGSTTVILRSFTRSFDDDTNRRVQEVRAWQTSATGGELRTQPLSSQEVRTLSGRDPISGASMPITPNLVFLA